MPHLQPLIWRHWMLYCIFDVQDRTMWVPQVCSRLCVMSMSGAVCQRCAPYPMWRDAEHGVSNGYGEAQATEGDREGRTTPDAADNTYTTEEGGGGEERGWKGTAVHSTYEDNRNIADRRGQLFDRNDGGRRDGGGRAGYWFYRFKRSRCWEAAKTLWVETWIRDAKALRNGENTLSWDHEYEMLRRRSSVCHTSKKSLHCHK